MGQLLIHQYVAEYPLKTAAKANINVDGALLRSIRTPLGWWEAKDEDDDRLGVVYTPNEIVRFMIEGADWLCEQHFGRNLIDRDVEILDPATGTGTFICELLEHFCGQPKKQPATQRRRRFALHQPPYRVGAGTCCRGAGGRACTAGGCGAARHGGRH